MKTTINKSPLATQAITIKQLHRAIKKCSEKIIKLFLTHLIDPACLPSDSCWPPAAAAAAACAAACAACPPRAPPAKLSRLHLLPSRDMPPRCLQELETGRAAAAAAAAGCGWFTDIEHRLKSNKTVLEPNTWNVGGAHTLA